MHKPALIGPPNSRPSCSSQEPCSSASAPPSQRTYEIWSFAFQFAWRYALLGQKWSYGKAGMTPEAVSARKKELAVWLREGLVKLGPT